MLLLPIQHALRCGSGVRSTRQARAVSCPPLSPDDEHRAVRVRGARPAHRAEEQTREAAVPAGSDDEHLGIAGREDELTGGIALARADREPIRTLGGEDSPRLLLGDLESTVLERVHRLRRVPRVAPRERRVVPDDQRVDGKTEPGSHIHRIAKGEA